jgi:hypothetical protein
MIETTLPLVPERWVTVARYEARRGQMISTLPLQTDYRDRTFPWVTVALIVMVETAEPTARRDLRPS